MRESLINRRTYEEFDFQEQKSSGVSYRTLAITVVVVLLASAGLCAAIVVPLFQNRSDQKNAFSTESLVEIQCGRVQGFIDEGVYVFQSIPYADSPTGRNRWKPPVPKSPENKNCWSGTYQATNLGHACFQNLGDFIGSEDCLFLNLWTPTLDKSALLPVMVYIHGGNLEILSGNLPDASPTPTLTSDTQAVYISFNYRLNAFGFMALDLLTSDSSTNSSGNYGFMDQLVVLNWVQNNIQHFGGNPSLVTVFGQSSGATSIMALLASPLSEGLFHRAWLMSSSAVLNKTLAEVSKDNLRFLNNTGCSTLDCLYNLTSEEVLSAIPMDEWPRWSMADLTMIPTKDLFNGALAIIDGYVLKEEPLAVFRDGRGMNVPVMIGTTAQETDITEPAPGVRTWTWDNYTDHVTSKLKPFGDNIVEKALQLYPSLTNNTPLFQLTTLSSDIRVTCPNDVLAGALAFSSNQRVYRYVVTSHPETPINLFGLPYASSYSFHGWDIVVLFGGLKTYFSEPSKDNLDFQRIQQQEMMYFVRNGFPYTQSWKPYSNSTAVLSSDIQIIDAYHSEECKLWLNNGFFSYGWIN